MSDDLLQRIAAVEWFQYQTAYGPASQEYIPGTQWPTSTPKLLSQLLSPDEKTALDAAHYLWCSICHQGALSKAGLVATPFLLEIAAGATPKLQTEIICIFSNWLAEYSDYIGTAGSAEPPTWSKDLMILLANNVPFFQKILAGADPGSELAEYTKHIIDNVQRVVND